MRQLKIYDPNEVRQRKETLGIVMIRGCIGSRMALLYFSA